MTINIPWDTLMYLCKYATLGRLVHGLIHNLNGPLHNLGMDIEMMQLSIAGENGLDVREFVKITKRLERMNDEFEHIAQMVKTTSLRLNPDERFDTFTSLRHFLEQELDFLNANLYFKHHVQTHLKLEEKLPPIATFPEVMVTSLRWFLQAIVEELEKQKIENLGLEVGTVSSSIRLDLITKGRALSDRFIDDLESDHALERLVMEKKNIGMRLAVGLMRSAGVDISGKNSPDQSVIRFTIPITR